MDTGFHTLEARVAQVDPDASIRKKDLQRGDLVLVRTKNSLYQILVLGEDQYLVSGGWFDREGRTPQVTGISGCTWGGSAIKQDVIASRGLFLEFENRVLTTRIKSVRVLRSQWPEQVN